MVCSIAVLLLPFETHVGTLFMTPSRALFMITVPYLLLRLLKGDYGRLLVVDYCMAFYIFWMAITVWIHHPTQLFTFTGSTALNILGGYLAARGTIRSVADFHAFARFMAGTVIFLLPFALYETFGKADSPLLVHLNNIIPGVTTYPDLDYCCRSNLNRAQAVFIHPIHFGLYAALPFSLYFLGLINHVSLTKRVIVGGLLGLACLCAVSSGPLLPLALQGCLILYTLSLRNNPNQWRILMAMGFVFYLILEANTTKFAFFALSEKLAFDSWNVYIRGVLYDAGMAQIRQTPIFGFGYNRLPQLPFWMTGSVDNFWLQIAVSHGVPALVAAMAAFIYPIIFIGGRRFTKGSDLYYARVSWTFVMIGLTLAMSTVAVWGTVQSAIFAILGAGMFLFYANEPEAAATTTAAQSVPVSRKPTYTRFPGGIPAGARLSPRLSPRLSR